MLDTKNNNSDSIIEESQVVLSLQDVSKLVLPQKRILDAISLNVKRGDFLIVAGANGSGKTMLMNLIAGLEPLSKGKIEPQNRNVGLVFQDADAQILGETPYEDIDFGLKLAGLKKDTRKAKIEEALKIADLTKKSDSKARTLSGGEKRRLAIASILALNPEIIILDEPFANLDWQAIRSLVSLLENLCQQKKTIILLTHELEKILALANRICILHAGTIVLDTQVSNFEKLCQQKNFLSNLENYGIRNPFLQGQSLNNLIWK